MYPILPSRRWRRRKKRDRACELGPSTRSVEDGHVIRFVKGKARGRLLGSGSLSLEELVLRLLSRQLKDVHEGRLVHVTEIGVGGEGRRGGLLNLVVSV